MSRGRRATIKEAVGKEESMILEKSPTVLWKLNAVEINFLKTISVHVPLRKSSAQVPV